MLKQRQKYAYLNDLFREKNFIAIFNYENMIDKAMFKYPDSDDWLEIHRIDDNTLVFSKGHVSPDNDSPHIDSPIHKYIVRSDNLDKNLEDGGAAVLNSIADNKKLTNMMKQVTRTNLDYLHSDFNMSDSPSKLNKLLSETGHYSLINTLHDLSSPLTSDEIADKAVLRGIETINGMTDIDTNMDDDLKDGHLRNAIPNAMGNFSFLASGEDLVGPIILDTTADANIGDKETFIEDMVGLIPINNEKLMSNFLERIC